MSFGHILITKIFSFEDITNALKTLTWCCCKIALSCVVVDKGTQKKEKKKKKKKKEEKNNALSLEHTFRCLDCDPIVLRDKICLV